MSDVRDRPGLAPEALPERFAVGEAAERIRLLQRLLDASVPVTLRRPDEGGDAVAAALLAIDPAAGRIVLRVFGHGAAAAALEAAPGLLGVAALDGVELRFDLGPVRLVDAGDGPALHAPLPRRLAWVQRRDAFRIAPPPTATPRLFVAGPDRPREARILDVSATGVALEWPLPGPVPAIGTHLPGCRLELPANPPIRCGLAVRSSAMRPDGSTRLGSEFVGMDPASARAVQVYVNLAQTHARRSRPRVD